MKLFSQLPVLTRYRRLTALKSAPCLLLVLAAFGCGESEVPRQTWTPLSDEQIVVSLGSPSGEFTDVPDAAVLSTIESRLPGVIEGARFLGHMATVIAQANDDDLESRESELPEAGDAPESTEKTAWATNLYLRIACPGLSIDPPFSFEQGEVRVDSPQLTGLDLSPLLKEGHFHLSFLQCELGPFLIDTKIAGRYLTDSSNLVSASSLLAAEKPAHVLAINAQTENTESTLGVMAVACGSATRTCSDLIRVAAEIDAGAQGTYVIAFELTKSFFSSPGSLSLTVRGADSESTCEVTGGMNPTVLCATE